MNTLNIVIADIHKVFAEGLAALLKNNAADAWHVHIITNRNDTLRFFEHNETDIAFIDIDLNEEKYNQLADQLGKIQPACKYIALTNNNKPDIIKSSLKGPFDAYILKTDCFDNIKDCITTVLSEEKYISPDCSTTLLNEISHNTNNTSAPYLTKREKEVLRYIANEMSSKEIANELFISEKTVEVHRSNLMLKLDAKNAPGLIRRSFETGLLNQG